MEKHVGHGSGVLPSWNQLGAATGRMSCFDPNLQQMPRDPRYRRYFVARPGRLLVKADSSQVELRVAAKVANEPVMTAAYKDGRDLHTMTAASVLGKPEAEVTKADRQLAKAVNFGLLYGMGWKSLVLYAKGNYGVTLTDAQARSYRTAFFSTYPALRDWHARVGDQLKRLVQADPNRSHEVRTLSGRRRLLPAAKWDANGSPYPNTTAALNTPAQGTAGDGLEVAIGLLWARRAECPGAVPGLFVHDEIVLEVPKPSAERASNRLRGVHDRGRGPAHRSGPGRGERGADLGRVTRTLGERLHESRTTEERTAGRVYRLVPGAGPRSALKVGSVRDRAAAVARITGPGDWHLAPIYDPRLFAAARR